MHSGPMVTGKPGSACATELSWKLVCAPRTDALHVAAQDGARPDVGAVLEDDVADDGGVGVDVRIGGEDGYPVTESMDGHARSISEDHMKFVHVATRTKDLDAALAFYEALGMKESRRSELTKGKATLAFVEPPEGNFAIELVYNWGKDDAYEGGERFGHFAFDVEDIDGLAAGSRRPAGRWCASPTCSRAPGRRSPSSPTPTATGSS